MELRGFPREPSHELSLTSYREMADRIIRLLSRCGLVRSSGHPGHLPQEDWRTANVSKP